MEISRNNCSAAAWMQRYLHFPHCKLSSLCLICVSFLSEGPYASFHKELDAFLFLGSLSALVSQTVAHCCTHTTEVVFHSRRSSPAFETTSLTPCPCPPAQQLLRALSAYVGMSRLNDGEEALYKVSGTC